MYSDLAAGWRNAGGGQITRRGRDVNAGRPMRWVKVTIQRPGVWDAGPMYTRGKEAVLDRIRVIPSIFSPAS